MSINGISLAETPASKSFTQTTPTFHLSSKVFAITGGASGIGFALTSLLVAEGAKVGITYVNESALPASLAALQRACKNGGEVFATRVDVRVRGEVDGWIGEVVRRYGQLDGAANLAGVIPRGIHVERVEEVDDEDWKNVLDVRLRLLTLSPCAGEGEGREG